MNQESLRRAGQGRRIEDTLNQINRYWRGSGVPRPERQDRLAELHSHLEEAAADGRDITDVTGMDIPAFAAGWIQADRRRPWLDIALRFIATLCLVSGALVLLGPFALGLDRFAVTDESAFLIALVSLAGLAVDVTRRYRGSLSSQTVTILGVGGLVLAGISGGQVLSRLDGRILAELPTAAAIALPLIGGACAVASWKTRRTSRTTVSD